MNARGRVFIVSDKKFPHGDAGGNRIEYMAKCFLHEGIEPIVISLGRNDSSEFSPITCDYNHEGIRYFNMSSVDGSVSFFNRYLKSGFTAGKQLLEYKINSNDKVIIYTTNPIFAKGVKRYLKDKCKIFYDAVEWDDKTSFKYGVFDPRYWLFNWCFYHIYPYESGVIAISKNIYNYFKTKCKAMVYPICLDYEKFHFNPLKVRERDKSKIKFIYPGNPGNKDDVSVVLRAINGLAQESKSKIEFHFTGVKKTTIDNKLDSYPGLLSSLQDTVFFHPWMEYNELLQLYSEMDSLLMVRKDNRITKSNFPSKVPELMACGVFITGNDSGDYFDYLEPDVNAIKIKSTSVEDCMEAINRILNMSCEEIIKMRLAAHECSKNKFNYTYFSGDLVQFVFEENANE